MSPDLDLKSDADLIAEVRAGDSEAYGVLYERHLHAAKRAASCLAHTPAEREDLVADAFVRVLRVLRDGAGPTEEFRAYLLVTMRNAAISTSRGASVAPYADVPEAYLPRPGGDPVMNRWEAMTAATAFASLPERWRTVLWHTEVEEETPAEIAPLLGMRPNGVAALAYRAREGLRQAYLRAHLAEVEGRECRATVAKLAGWVRRSVPVPLGRKISRHLAVCAECRARADALSRINEELRASVAPVLLGAAFAAAYVPAPGAAAASGAVAVKTLLAKIGVAAVIAAAAVTTVVSTVPNVAGEQPFPIPALANPTGTSDSIEGPAAPAGDRKTPADAGGTSTAATTTTLPAGPAPAAVTTTAVSTTAEDPKTEKQAAKESKQSAKEAAKESRKAEKEAAKESKKANK
ncbi:RNA polymerase sigma factor [Actinophytocola sp.]|uniref:RNA polymerase sigma factor n=1 Tax=Actinophytocola sp. TaxID=1872138 RepID=UPI00389AB1E1